MLNVMITHMGCRTYSCMSYYLQAYVKWCCKKKRGLSLGETDKEFKAYINQISGGRYNPPCRRTSIDILVHMTAKAQRKVGIDMKKLREQGVCPSISGMPPLCVITDD